MPFFESRSASSRFIAAGFLAILTFLCVPGQGILGAENEKVARFPVRSDGPKSLDPIRGSTQYDNFVCCQVYETLLQYKYGVEPFELEPLLLAEMPKLKDDGLTWQFTLKPGVRFHDDPCFPGGKGRPVVSSDVFFSWKRMADSDNLPKSWWLFEDTVKGFDEYREVQNAAEVFDYEAPVEGFKVIDDQRFEVTLNEQVTRFFYVLAMFQTSVVPREAVEKYGTLFSRHPVGTGPFLLKEENDWVTAKSIVLRRNPGYHTAGLPKVDKLVMPFYLKDNTMWLEFEAGNLDYSQVPAEQWPEVYLRRSRNLKRSYTERGMTDNPVPLLDFIFYGFNMDDELLGGYTDEKRYLRKAIALAVDWDERNESFYNGLNVVYDGMIPPGLAGHPPDGAAPDSYRGPDIQRAKEYLAKAGYPDGKGLPTIQYYTSLEANGPEQAQMLKRHLKEIGIELNLQLLPFSTLIENINKKQAPFFSFAWGSDYPDAENNLALFFGPNESPGANHFNYKNPQYDELYRKIRAMQPSPERTALYEKMRDMVMADCPYFGSMARIRWYLSHPWLRDFHPQEVYLNWPKYVDVDVSARG